MLVGEGLYGLRYLADSPYRQGHWWSEMAFGAVLLPAVGSWRLRGLLAIAQAGIAMTLTAGAFFAVYRLDLIAALPSPA
jgi:hypothetical protein